MKKIIFIILTTLFVVDAGYAQKETAIQKFQAKKTVVLHFANPNNQFLLNTVGLVIVKESPSDEIRCVVKIVTFGKTQAQADTRQHYIKISSQSGATHQTPELDIQTRNGLYPKRHYNIVTTVYVPENVHLQHNDNSNFVDLIKKLWHKIKS